jgi:thymidine kinase
MAKLFFRYSAMNAGKSTSLLQVAYNYEEQKQHVRLFTANVDDRYGLGYITSRLGVQREAQVFNANTDFEDAILQLKEPIACLLIDEAQFLSLPQVQQLHRIAHMQNIPVLCYGIRSDFQGYAFPGSSALLTLADNLEEIKTICSCGRKASMNMRVDEHGKKVKEGSQIEIGGNNRYRSVCPRCFYSA